MWHVFAPSEQHYQRFTAWNPLCWKQGQRVCFTFKHFPWQHIAGQNISKTWNWAQTNCQASCRVLTSCKHLQIYPALTSTHSKTNVNTSVLVFYSSEQYKVTRRRNTSKYAIFCICHSLLLFITSLLKGNYAHFQKSYMLFLSSKRWWK